MYKRQDLRALEAAASKNTHIVAVACRLETSEAALLWGITSTDDAKPADDPKDTSDGSCEGSRGPRRALGMSRAMYKIRGVAPRGLLVRLKDHVGRRLRTPEYFKIRLELSQERERIQAIVDTKAQALAIVYGLFLSVAIAVANAFVSGFLGMLLGVDVEM